MFRLFFRRFSSTPFCRYRNVNIDGTNGLNPQTVLALVAVSSSFSMGFYLLLEIYKFYYNNEKHKLIFLPLWFNPNVLFKSTYKYPQHLKYFNQDELNINGLKERIRYKVLSQTSMNETVKEQLGLPVKFEQDHPNYAEDQLGEPQADDFKVWIEMNTPTISGLKINLNQDKNMSVDFNWAIKLIDLNSFKNVLLKIPPEPEPEAIKLKNDSPLILSYVFTGSFKVYDNNFFRHGTIQYKGRLNNGKVEFELIGLIKDKIKYSIVS